MSRVLDTFLDLVRISSPTGRERRVAEYADAALSAAGCEVRYDETMARTGSDVGNLIGRLPGTAPGPVLAFSAHMDCVQPCEDVVPVVEGGIVRATSDTVLGGDDKVGVAAIIEAVRRLSESGAPHPDIHVLFTVGEEQGLLGAKALDAADAQSDMCFVLDADGPVGGIVTAAPSQYTFSAKFHGRSAHAGVEPEKGISAITMAADAIGRMSLGRLDDHTTANIGVITGGVATNIIAPSCMMTGECRSLDPDRALRVREDLDAAMRDAAHDAGGSVEVTWKLEYGGFNVAEDAPVVQLVRDACAELAIPSRCFATGGGSDGNVFSALGIPTLVLSSGMSKVHSTNEDLEVAQLERLADLVVAVSMRAAR